MEPWYATRQQVMRALDVQPSGRTALQVDRALSSASRGIDRMCLRRFYPEVKTVTFDWPAEQLADGGRLYLDGADLISVTAITGGGTSITSSVLLRPDTGPPYTYLELDNTTSAGYGGDSTQRAVSVTGLFGYRNDETTVTALNGGVTASVTTITVDSSVGLGVGSVIRIDSERMIVREMRLVDTGQDLTDALTAQNNDTSFGVADGTLFAVDEELTVDTERVRVNDVAGNTLIVDRSEAGIGALATHTIGTSIYAPRSLVVERGALGTTAAIHADNATVVRWDPPPEIQDLAVAMAIEQMSQEQAGYGRTSGSGESARAVSGDGLAGKKQAVLRGYGRRARVAAV